ncbi:hypothetical protein QAO71_17800 (plasmid) [Halopseudomonas sp. SMJS2]|uniref:hypothetical protein n=1 Tax=Halopseudomonas sp. SMJS2 TaxID=3041098 RepID=UPI0024534217|nr:hypothetical protein [Halopseudomonas sp. SMJS2]WGK63396.1 hypothetical protein QAO71_17800 [Halopseudomonas sp. SMJS2]
MSDSVPIFDPYAEIPFVGYRCPVKGNPESYWSMMHFVEAEKLRGVDDEYRAYILGLRDRDDFILETAGVAAQFEPSAYWVENRLLALYAGLYMQLVQNKDKLMPIIGDEEYEYPSPALKQTRDSIVERLASPEPWRRVLFLGQGEDSVQVSGIMDHIFSNRNPDEIFILNEPGTSDAVERYAHDNYIPIRILGIDASYSSKEFLGKISHVFCLGSLDAASESARSAYDSVSAEGMKIHQVDLSE